MQPPTSDVRRAFGVGDDEPQLLLGGQGRSWRCADLVLKPVDNEPEHQWVADVFNDWACSDTVRVPRPVVAIDGGWVYDGWAAHHWEPGSTASVRDEPTVVRVACEHFHFAVKDLDRPGFLDHRDDAWSFGDRVAWQEQEPQGSALTLGLIDDRLTALRPVESPAQVVHGDIGGNVLVADGLPPAVIDWPPYFRPAGWALAVAAVDAISWDGAPVTLLHEWGDVPEWDQVLLRAVIYRMATHGRNEAVGLPTGSTEEYVDRYGSALQAVLARLERPRWR